MKSPLELLRDLRQRRTVPDVQSYWQNVLRISRGEEVDHEDLDRLMIRLQIDESRLERDVEHAQAVTAASRGIASLEKSLPTLLRAAKRAGEQVLEAETAFREAEARVQRAAATADIARSRHVAAMNQANGYLAEFTRNRSELIHLGCPVDLLPRGATPQAEEQSSESETATTTSNNKESAS